jgi:predicted nucleotidyltransferase
MKRDEVLRILRDHREELIQFGIVELSLFGSVARGEAELDSDIDILVDFRGAATFDRYVDLQFYLERLLGGNVDLVTRRALRERIRPYVEKDIIRVA